MDSIINNIAFNPQKDNQLLLVLIVTINKKNPTAMQSGLIKKVGGYLLSQVKDQVPSAMRGLTSLFGMGRGEHPRKYHHK